MSDKQKCGSCAYCGTVHGGLGGYNKEVCILHIHDSVGPQTTTFDAWCDKWTAPKELKNEEATQT